MKIPYFRPMVGRSEIDEVVACLESGWLTTGARTAEFERAFADYVGVDHAVAANSCTAAMHLALAAIGLRRDEIVLVPTMTFPATASVVQYLDAVPVLVDCDPVTLSMDVEAARETLERIAAGRLVPGLRPPYGRVRAIMPMHYGGQMADMAGVRELAGEYDLAVIEDAAHALPASYRETAQAPWEMAGTGGNVGCFSFYANKCITTGEGGMAVTQSAEIADRMRVMSHLGMSLPAWLRESNPPRLNYEVVCLGYKYNLTDVAAAIGLHQLTHADGFLEARRAVVDHYRAALESLPGLGLPVEVEGRRSAWHLYVVRVGEELGVDRDNLINGLTERGIGTSLHWRPLHLHAHYRETFGYRAGDLPVSEAIWPTLVSLPIYPSLGREDVQVIAAAIREIAEGG